MCKKNTHTLTEETCVMLFRWKEKEITRVSQISIRIIYEAICRKKFWMALGYQLPHLKYWNAPFVSHYYFFLKRFYTIASIHSISLCIINNRVRMREEYNFILASKWTRFFRDIQQTEHILAKEPCFERPMRINFTITTKGVLDGLVNHHSEIHFSVGYKYGLLETMWNT